MNRDRSIFSKRGKCGMITFWKDEVELLSFLCYINIFTKKLMYSRSINNLWCCSWCKVRSEVNWNNDSVFFIFNYHKTIIIWSDEGKEKSFCILHMLRIHNGLQKLIKKNVYDLHLKKMNPFDRRKPCIKISKGELLFEQ